MLQSLRILVLVLAIVGGATALIAHRRSAGSPTSQWLSRSNVLLSLAIVVGTAPGLFFPSATWLALSGLLGSLALTAASMTLLRRQRRASRSQRP